MDMDSFLAGVFFVWGIYLLFKIGKLQDDVKGMKNTLDQIANKVQVPESLINDD